MCKKLFDSLIFNFFFFCLNYAALSFASGGALVLGATIQSTVEPENKEYAYYASSSGFSIGLKSALYMQWLTAAFTTFFLIANMGNKKDTNCFRTVSVHGIQAGILLILFDLLHLPTLPQSVLNENTCLKLQTSTVQNAPEHANPLCDPSHSWTPLFSAFYLGGSILLGGVILLYFIFLCGCHFCENSADTESVPTQITSAHEQNYIFEMIQITAQDEYNLSRTPNMI
jgi:hypothetical protein